MRAMKLKMGRQSLFATLLRSPWWVSFVLGGVMAAVARLALPQPYEFYALFSAVPFAGIGCIAAWKQLRAPSAARVGAALAAAESLPWPKFADTVEQACGATARWVTRLPGPAADFEVTRAGRLTLVACRRWKAARVGVEPLRELRAAMDRGGASAGLHVALGEPTDAARAYAAAHGIELLQGPALAALLARAPRPKKG
jgi:restriction system protein